MLAIGTIWGMERWRAPFAEFPMPSLLRQTLKEERFAWIAQVFSNMFVRGGTVQQHLLSLRSQIDECLDGEPLFFNCHSGSDAWSMAEAEDFYGACQQMEKEIGVVLSHETHRSRYFANPWNTATDSPPVSRH